MDLASNPLEKEQVKGADQGHPSLYASTTFGHQPWSSTPGSGAVEWNSLRTDENSLVNGIPSISSYHDDRQTKATATFQDGRTVASTTHDYSAYTTSQNSTDPYAHLYQSQYYDFQHPSSSSSHQQVGVVQNTGAPYQPLSSFQNASSYVGPTSYSSTYYNPGDYQTTAGYQPEAAAAAAAGYQGSDYSHQTNVWNDGNYGSHQYPTYSQPDATAAQYNSTPTIDASHYQQQYGQWAGYYSQTPSDVMCAPGTEHMAHSSASSGSSVPDYIPGYPAGSIQPPPPGTTSWRRDTTSSGFSSSLQGKDVTGQSQNNDWQNRPLVFGNRQGSQVPSHFQQAFGSTPLSFTNMEEQKKMAHAQGPNVPFSSSNQVRPNFRPALNPLPTLEGLRVSKFQIQTNPRIATKLASSIPKMDKEPIKDTPSTPAYINVSLTKPDSKVPSHDSSESMVKQGAFPPSLRAYVERSFARCRDDAQRLSNQSILKEIISKASADGTLHVLDWDTEPLFPLPATSADHVNKGPQTSVSLSPWNKLRRSPGRRTKSRWEPVVEEKLTDKTAHLNHVPLSNIPTFNRFKAENSSDFARNDGKRNGWNDKSVQKPAKKQRLSESSDSDKDQDLTKYYSSASSLADSPERRKREHRSKRFEKGQESKAEQKGRHQAKAFRSGGGRNKSKSNIYLASKPDDGPRRAVEDMDWDSFTVKGTCQEIEKRYLRLTSAPDPATVRPEDVLEKALAIVQSTSKNYLYKCDQLKSIRQDLTVQRIRNEFTAKVYETHARLALEAGDLPEYNQCQSQLKTLYGEGIKGCHFEFSAYHLLCVILHSSNNRELLASMGRLSPEAKRDEAVQHALQVRSAVTSGNYVLFFRLYKKAPNLGTCLMDLYVEKMRYEAVKCISKSYRPTVPVAFVAQTLGFTDAGGVEDCAEWLRAHGAAITVDGDGEMLIDSKTTSVGLFMPEPEDAVAHGDSNLAVDDFFTRAP